MNHDHGIPIKDDMSSNDNIIGDGSGGCISN